MTFTATSRLLALLILSLGVAGTAQAAASDGRVTLELCSSPDYPREAFKYGIAGQVSLGFDLTAAGAVDSISILKGSGWAALDEAAITALAKCQFPTDVAATKQKFLVNYMFRPSQLNPGVTLPVIRQDTCPASEIFGDFISSREDATGNNDGVLMRFEVDEVGRAHGVQFEERAWDARILSAAQAHVESCRFNPSKRAGVKSRGAASGRLTLKPSAAK
jgi:TonB family protein